MMFAVQLISYILQTDISIEVAKNKTTVRVFIGHVKFMWGNYASDIQLFAL